MSETTHRLPSTYCPMLSLFQIREDSGVITTSNLNMKKNKKTPGKFLVSCRRGQCEVGLQETLFRSLGWEGTPEPVTVWKVATAPGTAGVLAPIRQWWNSQSPKGGDTSSWDSSHRGEKEILFV